MIGAVWAVCVLLWLHLGLLKPDGVGYVVYLPSTLLDRDLLFFDEWAYAGMIRGDQILYKDVTSAGYLSNHWTVGCALVWYPPFLLGDLYRFAFPEMPRDGLSLPYNVPVVFTSALAGLAALLVSFALARRMFAPAPALTATLAIWFGSPLIWYSLRHASMSHAIGAAVCALFVMLALRLRDGVTAERLFSAGLALGFAVAVRPQNAPLVLVPLLILERAALRQAVARCAYAMAGGAIGVLPQLVVSQAIWGSPLAFVNVGGDRANDWNSFQRVNLVETLFSSWHGLVPWTPLLAVAVAGFFALHRTDRGLARAAIVCFVVQWLLLSLMDRAFWGGSSFGQRRFDNCTIFFVCGLAALFAKMPRIAAIGIASAGSLWTMALFLGAKRINLNKFQTQSELLDVQLTALRELDAIGFMTFIPPHRRVAVLLMMLGVTIAIGMLALLVARLARRPARLSAIAAAYLGAASLFLAWCGSNQSNRPPWDELIAANRRPGHLSGVVLNTTGSLGDEVQYLEKTGRHAEAERTRREIQEILRRHTAVEKAP